MIRSFGGKTPRIHPDAFVSEMAYVVGDVEIGPGTGIWPGAVIRADFSTIRIGANSQIEDNVVLHTATPMEIGDNVTLGHCVVMHGKRIGNNVLVGNNATVLDNVEIDDYCLIGAGALVNARLHVPTESFVIGIPGEILPLPDHLRPMLTRGDGGGGYSDLGRRYKEAGLGSGPVDG